jgi:hypothetical protein
MPERLFHKWDSLSDFMDVIRVSDLEIRGRKVFEIFLAQ